MIPTTETKDLRQTYKAEETAPSNYYTDTNMTSTWANPWSVPRVPARQFDSEMHDLMLDDGASACITNCKEDFVEPPKRVDWKVKRDKRERGRHSSRYTQVVPRRQHQTGARHHDSRGLPYSRSVDKNLVSTTPRPTSQ